MIRRALTWTIAFSAAAILGLLVARVALPNDTWVLVETPRSGGSSILGREISPDGISLSLETPRSGIQRADLRLHVTPHDPEHRRGELRFRLRDAKTGETLWTGSIDTRIVPDDGWTELDMRSAESQGRTVELEITAASTHAAVDGRSTAVRLWELSCDCAQTARLDGSAAPDAEVRTWTDIGSGADRLRLVRDRIAATTPSIAGPGVIVVAAAIGFVTTVILLMMIWRWSTPADRRVSEPADARFGSNDDASSQHDQ